MTLELSRFCTLNSMNLIYGSKDMLCFDINITLSKLLAPLRGGEVGISICLLTVLPPVIAHYWVVLGSCFVHVWFCVHLIYTLTVLGLQLTCINQEASVGSLG